MHSAEWHQDWEPCFKDRPADRIVAMRMLDVVVGFHDYRQTAGTGGKAKTSRATAEEMAAWIGSARVKQMIDDIELLANHGCGVAQAGFALFYWVGFGPIRADGTESLKWLMLAQEAGYEAARNGLESFMPDYTPEEIAKARALAEAWRPSD